MSQILQQHAQESLKNYHIACNRLADAFLETYFKGHDGDWVANRVGEIFYIDYIGGIHFNMEQMATAIRIKADIDELLEYDDLQTKGKRLENFENWVKFRRTNSL